MVGGAKAGTSGNSLERDVESALLRNGYQAASCSRREVKEFILALRDEPDVASAHPLYKSGAPAYASQLAVFKSIFDTEVRCDFVIWHPQRFPYGAIVECKSQTSSGSVDEKLAYLYLNILERAPCPTIVVYRGEGFRPEALEWMRSKVDHHKLLGVLSPEGFEAFLG